LQATVLSAAREEVCNFCVHRWQSRGTPSWSTAKGSPGAGGRRIRRGSDPSAAFPHFDAATGLPVGEWQPQHPRLRGTGIAHPENDADSPRFGPWRP
jgi:hypothetical protein